MHTKKVLSLSIFIGLIVGLIILTPFFLGLKKPSNQSNVRTIVVPTSYPQRTQIQKTTQQELEKRSDILKKTTLPDGTIEYQFPSNLNAIPDTALVQNGIVVFEKTSLPLAQTNPKSKNATEIATELGAPEAILKGSADYGNLVDTFVYPQKGFAFVGSLRTNEVYQLQYFKPMTLDQYKKIYGDEIEQVSQGE